MIFSFLAPLYLLSLALLIPILLLGFFIRPKPKKSKSISADLADSTEGIDSVA